jgi:fluoroquinolone resistance protein
MCTQELCQFFSISIGNVQDKRVQTGVTLQKLDFHGYNLRGALLKSCEFKNADMTGAQLECADFRGSRVEGLMALATDLKGAIVDPAQAMVFAELLGLKIR